MQNINPNALVFIAFCTLLGGIFGSYLIGATIGTGLVVLVTALSK
jgi:hypothetical protein